MSCKRLEHRAEVSLDNCTLFTSSFRYKMKIKWIQHTTLTGTGVTGLRVPRLECSLACKLTTIIIITIYVYCVNVMTYVIALMGNMAMGQQGPLHRLSIN